MNKEQLKALSDKTFFDNDAGEIQPQGQRHFNDEMIAALAAKDEVCDLVPYTGENLILKSTAPIYQSGRALFYITTEAAGVMGDTTITIETSAEANIEVVYRDAHEATVATIGTVVCSGIAVLHSVNIPATADRVAIYTANPNVVTRVKLERGAKATPWSPAFADMAQAIDYSSLEEQEVPGEYWLVNGERKPVYVNTFIGTTPEAWSVVEAPIVGSPAGLTSLVYVCGHVGSQLTPNWQLANGVLCWTYRYAANLIQLGVPNINTTNLKGVPFSLTFKYTK